MGQGEPCVRPRAADQLPGAIQLLLSRAQTCCRERLALRPADD